MLYVDIPTPGDLVALTSHREDICVSIYLPTTPLSQEAAADRIALRNMGKEVAAQLEAAGADKRRVASLLEQLDDLVDDTRFWQFQARSLAIFATPGNLRTFRLPNALEAQIAVADRFHLTPLLRAVSFPNVAYVLALSENAVRLVEVSADMPAGPVAVDGMPRDAASAVSRASVNDRSPSGRIHGSEGQTVLLRQYARQVDAALRGLLAGRNIPLVLAATQPLAAIYRSVNTYPHLAAAGIDGSPETLGDAELAQRARPVLDGLYQEELDEWRQLFRTRESQGRATADIAQAARAATFGAVDSLLVDIDSVTPGTVREEDGAVTFAEHAGAGSYGIVDEVAGRVILSGGRVLGVRKADIPGGQPLAAILRYPV